MRKVRSGARTYTNAQRADALSIYAVNGSFLATSKIVDIPRKTITDWARTEWGLEVLNQLYKEQDMLIRSRFAETINMCIDQQHERLKNGDIKGLDDEGNVIRQPINFHQLSVAGGIAADKIAAIRRPTTDIAASTNALQDISRQLEEFAKSKREKLIEGKAIVVKASD